MLHRTWVILAGIFCTRPQDGLLYGSSSLLWLIWPLLLAVSAYFLLEVSIEHQYLLWATLHFVLNVIHFEYTEGMSGTVGLAVSSALMIMGTLQYAIRQTANVESYMTSVERLLEYVKTPPEAPLESKPGKVTKYYGLTLESCEVKRSS